METINIIRSLVMLLGRANFNVTVEGAAQMTSLVQQATDLVADLEREEADEVEVNNELAEIESDVK